MCNRISKEVYLLQYMKLIILFTKSCSSIVFLHKLQSAFEKDSYSLAILVSKNDQKKKYVTATRSSR